MHPKHYEPEEEDGRGGRHAIDAVHYSTVTGEQTAAVFYACKALEQTLGEVANDGERDDCKTQWDETQHWDVEHQATADRD
jgi:hypothetical protein